MRKLVCDFFDTFNQSLKVQYVRILAENLKRLSTEYKKNNSFDVVTSV